jgi:hypothetical protein
MLFPKRIAIFIFPENYERGFVDSLASKRIHRGIDERCADTLPLFVSGDGGVMDVPPAPVVTAQNDADDFAVSFGDKTGVGISSEVFGNTLAGIIKVVKPHVRRIQP